MRNNMSSDRLASSPPMPRQRGASVGSSGIENLSSSHFNQFSRHAKARLSANDPSSRLSSISTASTSITSSFASEHDSDGFYAAHRSSDPLVNDDYYAAQLKRGNFIKMGWLTKQGHMWYVVLCATLLNLCVCICGAFVNKCRA